MRTSFGRLLFVVLLSALPLAGCGGELYLDANETRTDFDDIDRDPTDDGFGGDNGDGDGSSTDDGDFDGDSILGDGFGDFDGDGSSGGCGYSTEPCPSGQECVEGGCVTICPVERCEVSRACCAAGTECVLDRFCRPPCPNSADQRCGSDASVCCNSGNNEICGPQLSCIQNCAGQGPLCGNDGQAGTFGSVCCNGNDPGTTEDDDVCVFDRCVARGGECESFLDCEPGEYCELTLHEETSSGEPDTGYCLPNEFPPDAPICQAAPDDAFVPTTEWSWVGIQLVGSDLNDTVFWDNFAPGQVVRRCDDANDRNCYREPCTENPTSTGSQKSRATCGNGTEACYPRNCFRSVETIPTTADVDKTLIGGKVVPEVVFKAYADATFDNVNGNVLVIADGRADNELPDTGIPSKQQRSKVVIFGETRGHVAIGNLDGDEQLEIVAAHRPGLCVYDPYSPTTPGNALEGCISSGSLAARFTGGAPHLADLDADGVAEIIIGGVILRHNPGAAPTVLLDLGLANQGGDSNAWFNANGERQRCGADQECFSVTAVADVNLDGMPEILTGNRALTIKNIGGTWSFVELWRAKHDDSETIDPALGPGFPGVGDFITGGGNTTPEVAVVYDGRVFFLSGATGRVLRSPVAGSEICTTDAVCRDRVTQATCTTAGDNCGWTGGCYINNAVCTSHNDDQAGCQAITGCTWNSGTNKCNRTGTPTCSVKTDVDSCNAFNVLCDWNGACNEQATCGNITTSSDCEAQVGCSWERRELNFKLLNNRGGPPNIADFDGDGRPEVSFAGTGCMVVVDPDCATATAEQRATLGATPGSGCSVAVPGPGSPAQRTCSVEVQPGIANEIGLLWMYQTQDQSSAVTGTSVFDFQGDGKAEVLYNDECFFRVFEGATSKILYEKPNSHRTATEYPIVVDVDGDSNSEIVVVSTGDQSSSQSSPRDRCGGPAAAGPTTCDGLNETNCNNTAGCRYLLSACRPYAYRRAGFEQYTPNACDCSDHTSEGQAACDAARGCEWSGSSCQVVSAATCSALTTQAACQTRMDDCLWDPYQGSSGACEEHPRGQAYVCTQSTWGVTAFGDPEFEWVKTLPYWYEHPFHITNQDRFGNVVPDWHTCYTGSICAAQTDPVACENTYVNGGSSGPLCAFGDSNPDFYNNFRQNVPGFVPLNAPDLQVESVVGDIRECPPKVTIIARIVNKGRAGVTAEDADIAFYRLTNLTQTPVQTAAGTPFATVDLPHDLLPGGSAVVSATYQLTSSEAPIDLNFRVIANPEFLTDPNGATFECNSSNNSRDLLDLNCTGSGG